MTEQADKKTDALDIAASSAPGVAAVAAQPPRTRFAALDVSLGAILGRVKQLREPAT